MWEVMPKVVNIAWSLLVLGQSLTFRTPQLYQEMEIALTEKKEKPGTTPQVVFHLQELSLLTSTFPSGQRGFAKFLILSSSLTASVYL